MTSISNKLYDVIIVGASKEALELIPKLTGKSVLLISKEPNIDCGVDYFSGETSVLRYSHGAFTIYFCTDTTKFAYGKNVIVATGGYFKDHFIGKISTRYLYYSLSDLTLPGSTIVITGNNEMAGKYAIKLARAGATVYLVSDEDKQKFTKTDRLLIANLKKIIWLPRAVITDTKEYLDIDKLKVTLNSYEDLYCDILCDFSDRRPDYAWVQAGSLITYEKINEKIKIKTDESGSTELLSNLFAIGECASKAVDIDKLSQKIL